MTPIEYMTATPFPVVKKYARIHRMNDDDAEEKLCPKCKEVKEVGDFYWTPSRQRYSSWCIVCLKDRYK